MSLVIKSSFFGFTNKNDTSQLVVFNQQGLRDAGSDLIEGIWRICVLQKKVEINKKSNKLHDFLSDMSEMKNKRGNLNKLQEEEIKQFYFMIELFERMGRMIENGVRYSFDMKRQNRGQESTTSISHLGDH